LGRELLMKTKCCDYEWGANPCPVFWNKFSAEVVCHNCGSIYRPRTDMNKIMKDAEEAIERLKSLDVNELYKK
jgi:hypothetical protein